MSYSLAPSQGRGVRQRKDKESPELEARFRRAKPLPGGGKLHLAAQVKAKILQRQILEQA